MSAFTCEMLASLDEFCEWWKTYLYISLLVDIQQQKLLDDCQHVLMYHWGFGHLQHLAVIVNFHKWMSLIHQISCIPCTLCHSHSTKSYGISELWFFSPVLQASTTSSCRCQFCAGRFKPALQGSIAGKLSLKVGALLEQGLIRLRSPPLERNFALTWRASETFFWVMHRGLDLAHLIFLMVNFS